MSEATSHMNEQGDLLSQCGWIEYEGPDSRKWYRRIVKPSDEQGCEEIELLGLPLRVCADTDDEFTYMEMGDLLYGPSYVWVKGTQNFIVSWVVRNPGDGNKPQLQMNPMFSGSGVARIEYLHTFHERFGSIRVALLVQQLEQTPWIFPCIRSLEEFLENLIITSVNRKHAFA